jgi:serine/threonine protein kinase
MSHDFIPSSYDETRDSVAATEPADLDRDIVARELSAEYQVVRQLGRGANGVVYLARDLALHRVVAIKALRWELLSSPDDAERFRREARTSAQLSHPSIVPLHTFGETPNLMYMVLRYVPGESLGARLRRERRMTGRETRQVLASLALTLEYAHRQGIVHRDLKPENILLESGGDGVRPMLMDFGVAMRRSYDPPPGELRRSFGTPHFMSPEQAAGELDLDGRSDLYSLGVLGYLMLSGVLPFTADTVTQLAAKHATGTHVPLAALAPGAPADVVDAIERCLAKEPEARWRTARELHAALTNRQSRMQRIRWNLVRAGARAGQLMRRLFEFRTIDSPWPLRG